jgi:8-oxo-dGTP pyrophosphatase MutT (NUDIX family)
MGAEERSMSDIRPAATVILLRPRLEGGFEIFMAKRHKKSGFLPNAWVFPGGRVDDGDGLVDHPAIIGGERAFEAMGLKREEALPYMVAAVRETFEESGIWLGNGVLPDPEREPLHGGDIGLGDLLDKYQAGIDLDGLVPWAWWVTPAIERRRFNTRFFVAAVPEVDGSHDAKELVESAWYTPSQALELSDRGSMGLVPPTWWTLKEIDQLADISAVIADGSRRSPKPVMPIANFADGVFELALPGHPDHPEPKVPGFPTRVRFMGGRWRADL